MDEKIYQMKVSKIYPLLVAKAERKGRTREEVDEMIEDPILREIRYLDKLVDELAKGKAMEKILPDRKNSRDM